MKAASFPATREQHRVNDILWPVLKPAVRTTTTLGALQVRVREVFRVVRAVDTTDGQLFIDLIFKVEGEDGLRASIYQTFHWSTNPVHKMEQGSRTSSHAADSVKIFFPESTKIQVQTRSSPRRKCNLRLTPHHYSQCPWSRKLTLDPSRTRS